MLEYTNARCLDNYKQNKYNDLLHLVVDRIWNVGFCFK